MKIVLPTLVACLVVSSVAAAETPHPAAAPPPAPKVAAPRAALPVTPRLPKTIAVHATEPKAAQTPKTHATERKTNEAEGKAPVPTPRIQTRVSDPGITLHPDETGTRIIVRGTAEGPQLIDYMGKPTQNPRHVSYEVARGVSFEIDKHEMPDFSKDASYRRKNAWYFSHLATFSPSRGDSALRVAQALAASLAKGDAYEAKVSPTDDGAVIEIAKR